MSQKITGISRLEVLRLLGAAGIGMTSAVRSHAARPLAPPGVEEGGKGKWFPSEMRKYRDRETGREVWQLTRSPYDSGNLYFHSQSFTRGNKGLVFMSTRPKKTELYYIELKSGRFRQLTEAETGVHTATVSPNTDAVVYTDNGAVWWLKLTTLETRKIFTVPSGYTPNILSIDDSGQFVAFAYARQLEKPLGPDQTHHSVLVRVNTDGSGFQKVHEEDYWISHVLINPTDPGTIFFCHEGGWRVVAQRMWIVQADGSGLRKIREEEEPEVAIGHENWTEQGGALGYHGSYKGRSFLGRIRKDGSGCQEFTMTAPSGHTTFTPDGRFVLGDGTREYHYIFLYRLKHDLAIAEPPICSYGPGEKGDVHAHAGFSSDGQYIVFASAREGHTNVYVVRTRP